MTRLCETKEGCPKLEAAVLRGNMLPLEEGETLMERNVRICGEMQERLSPEVLALAPCPAEAFSQAIKAELAKRATGEQDA